MGPSWTPTFPLLRTPAPALFSLFSSLPFNVQPQMALLQAGYSLLGDVFSILFVFIFLALLASMSFSLLLLSQCMEAVCCG